MKVLASAMGKILLSGLLLSLAACGARHGAGLPVEQRFTYASVPIDVQIEEADVIFAGTVTGISQTRWNQDSGEYWEERVQDGGGDTLRTALPYYTIELLVERCLAGDAQVGEKLVVTQVGTSPRDEASDRAGSSERLRAGDQVVMFVRRSEMAWRDGTRPILGLFTVPEHSCFVLRDDGLYETPQLTGNGEMEKSVPLDDLIARIRKLRDARGQ
ncbi:MAG: hypothetical protein QME94_07760 [Anaerolineae bacterium]|nr:hypothetical protein [Anaerolineae bacterium]